MRRKVVDHLRLRLALVAADDSFGVGRSPQLGEVAHDAGVGTAVKGVVAELALDAVDVLDGTHDRPSTCAVRVDERAIDVEEDETFHGPGV